MRRILVTLAIGVGLLAASAPAQWQSFATARRTGSFTTSVAFTNESFNAMRMIGIRGQLTPDTVATCTLSHVSGGVTNLLTFAITNNWSLTKSGDDLAKILSFVIGPREVWTFSDETGAAVTNAYSIILQKQ